MMVPFVNSASYRFSAWLSFAALPFFLFCFLVRDFRDNADLADGLAFLVFLGFRDDFQLKITEVAFGVAFVFVFLLSALNRF